MEQTQKIDQSEAYLLAANLMRGAHSPKRQLKQSPPETTKLDIMRRYKLFLKRKRHRENR